MLTLKSGSGVCLDIGIRESPSLGRGELQRRRRYQFEVTSGISQLTSQFSRNLPVGQSSRTLLIVSNHRLPI